jgi:uncharacterized protein (TIGR00255 family)
MTGYGAAERDGGPGRVRVEIRALNHRFLDLSLNLPSALYPHEAELRARIAAEVKRARLDVWITWSPKDEEGLQVKVNRTLLAELHRELEEVRTALGIVSSDVGIDVLTRFPEVVTVARPASALSAAARDQIEGCLRDALAALDKARLGEGVALVRDLRARFDNLAGLVEAAAKSAEAEPTRIVERLRERLQALVADLKLDPERLHQEAAFLAERADVTEELVRLRAHIDRARALFDGGEELGKAIDFLLQEVGREVNTLGSKLRATETTGFVLAMKAEVEKIREQARNLE